MRQAFRTAPALALALLSLCACATVPRQTIRLPLALYGDQPAPWSGRVDRSALSVEQAGRTVITAPPEHLVLGLNSLLFNAPITGGEEHGGNVSLLVDPGRCRAAGRDYPYTVYLGRHTPHGDRVWNGCAGTVPSVPRGMR